MFTYSENKDNPILITKKHPEKQINLGMYNFLNCLPIALPLDNIPENIILKQFGTPNMFNRYLSEGIVDVTPVSTYEYLKNKHKYQLLNGLSINAKGQVGSVMLFSKYEFEELKNKKIALTNTSSTSVSLLKIIFKKVLKDIPDLYIHKNEKTAREYLKEYDAVLLIGDPALIANYKLKNDKNIIIYDLATLWKEYTTFDPVFCVWCALKTWAEKYNNSYEFINECLIKSKTLGLNQMYDKVIIQAATISDLPKEYLDNYYKNQLCYDFEEAQMVSIKYYYTQLKENNLL